LKLRDDADLAYYDKAIKYLDLYPKECAKITAKCYDRIGDIHEAKEQHKTALASYLTALKLDKALPETYEKVGELLFNDHNYAGALKYFKVVNNIIKVAECFGELIKQNPKDAGLRLEKGDYYLSIGLHEKAVVYYKQAFSLSKDGAFKANVLKKQSSAMKDHSQKLAIKAQDLGHQAENMNFYNFDEINFSDLEGYQLSVTGDDAGLGAIL
jgi:tetratricopeptide (TPR) repeat protein